MNQLRRYRSLPLFFYSKHEIYIDMKFFEKHDTFFEIIKIWNLKKKNTKLKIYSNNKNRDFVLKTLWKGIFFTDVRQLRVFSNLSFI